MKVFQTSSLPSVRTPSEHVPFSADADDCDSQEVAVVHPTIQARCHSCTRSWHTGRRPQQETCHNRTNRCLQLLNVHPVPSPHPEHATTNFAFQDVAPPFPSACHGFGCPPGLVPLEYQFPCLLSICLCAINIHYTDSLRHLQTLS